MDDHDKQRQWWRDRLEGAVKVAWLRRNGYSGEVDDFDGAELLEIESDIEVSPLWSWIGSRGGRGWSNWPGENAAPDGWLWKDVNPPVTSWVQSMEDMSWMGDPEYSEEGDDVRRVTWVVSGPHSEPPPVPDELIEYLCHAEQR